MGGSPREGAAALDRLTIRPATPADLVEVVAMERKCYGDPWPETAFAALPFNPRVFFAVARPDGVGPLAGYVVAWYVVDEGELANLAVAPPLRKQGVGRLLLDAVLADAHARGTREIYLEVRESNAAARELYRSREFEEVGRRRHYYRNPTEDALILRRSLKR